MEKNKKAVKKMTEAEIIKDFTEIVEFCRKCENLTNELDVLGAALDLINRQKAIIERTVDTLLKKEYLMQKMFEQKQKYYDGLQQAMADIERLNKKAEKVFEATINKVLSMKGHYVIVDNKFVECEMMEDLEFLFGMEFCEFNDDYEENLDNLLKELAGDTE